jgi:hypothetical protein
METHAQELHKAPSHGWKHYLFEFFMLFLAVFCGFLAENLREQQADHSREKEYMESLLSNLSADTASFKRAFPSKAGRAGAIDTMFIFFNTHSNEKAIFRPAFEDLSLALRP